MSRIDALTSSNVPHRDTLRVSAALAAFPEQYVPSEFKELFVQRAITATSAVAEDEESSEDLQAVRRWLSQIAKSTTRLTSSMAVSGISSRLERCSVTCLTFLFLWLATHAPVRRRC